MSGLALERFVGSAVEPYLPALARLRLEVFREYPYLYEGSPEYEERYLRAYAACPQSVVIIARDGAQVVGASTAMPLTAHGEGLAPVLEAEGIDPRRVYYFGESVLSAAYRGRGLGHAFFDVREASAREYGFSLAAFCAVERPQNHPARPSNYVSHDAFWHRRGYTRRADLRTMFAWRDLGEREETQKTMVFWLKELAA